MAGIGTPIKLAQIIYVLCLGGSEVLAWRLARSLNATGGYACSVYGVARGGPLADLLSEDGIPSYAYTRRGRFDLSLIGRMAWRLRRDGVQVVHTHAGQLLCGGLAAKLAGARLVHTEHDSHSLMKPRTQRLFRVLAQFADRITTVSEPVTRFLRDQIGIPEAKLQTIPNGVLVEAFRDASRLAREPFGWNDRDVVIGCVARLEAEKGHYVLLQSCPCLACAGADIGTRRTCAILGGRSDVPAVLASCDVFVLPSLKEGLPLSILEAMAGEKAVVASAVGSIAQIVSEGETGLLVPAGDARASEHALGSLVADEALQMNLGRRGQSIVSDRYHFHAMVKAYRDVYEDGVLSARYRLGDAAAGSSVLR